MKLIYREVYGYNQSKKGEYNYFCIPTLKLFFNENDILLNLKEELIEEDDGFKYANIPFIDGLFECLSESVKNKLDSIFQFGNKVNYNDEEKGYLNKTMWKSFLFTSNVKLAPIHKHINSFNIDKDKIKNEKQHTVEAYYSSLKVPFNNDISSIQFDLLNMFEKNLLDKQSINQQLKHKYKIVAPKEEDLALLDMISFGKLGGQISIDYEMEINTELELLYTFLDCLFSSEYNYIIKKCSKCSDYYISFKMDSVYCPLCKKTTRKNRNRSASKDDLNELENRVNSIHYGKIYSTDEERNKALTEYTNAKNKAKKKYANNKKELATWYINQYANPEKARKKYDYLTK